LRRVLKIGGRMIIIDVISPNPALLDTHLQTVELLRDASHVRNYTWQEWNVHTSASGFRIAAHSTWKLRLEFAHLGGTHANPGRTGRGDSYAA
jgi:hypothetical protein